MKYRRMLYLQPTGAQTSVQLIQGAEKTSYATGTAADLRTQETNALHREISAGRFFMLEIEDGRRILVATGSIQTAEVEIIQ